MKTCPKGILRDGVDRVYQSLDVENLRALVKTAVSLRVP
jgi:hypothetical protein